MPSNLDVRVTLPMAASPERVRALMFDARYDPEWMAAVKSVEPLADDTRPARACGASGAFSGAPCAGRRK